MWRGGCGCNPVAPARRDAHGGHAFGTGRMELPECGCAVRAGGGDGCGVRVPGKRKGGGAPALDGRGGDPLVALRDGQLLVPFPLSRAGSLLGGHGLVDGLCGPAPVGLAMRHGVAADMGMRPAGGGRV